MPQGGLQRGDTPQQSDRSLQAGLNRRATYRVVSWNSLERKAHAILAMLPGTPVQHILPPVRVPMLQRHNGATAACGRARVSERSDGALPDTIERASSLIVSRSRTEIEAEPHTRSSAALAAALFNASASDSGDAASGEFGTSRMTWFSAMMPPCF